MLILIRQGLLLLISNTMYFYFLLLLLEYITYFFNLLLEFYFTRISCQTCSSHAFDRSQSNQFTRDAWVPEIHFSHCLAFENMIL